MTETKIIELFSDFSQIWLYDEVYDPEIHGELVDGDLDLNKMAYSIKRACVLFVIATGSHLVKVNEYENRPSAEDKWDHIVDVPLYIENSIIDANDAVLSTLKGDIVLRWKIKKLGQFEGQYEMDLWREKISEVSVIKNENIQLA